MSDPKQLRFQFTVDEASLQKTRQLIRELTSDLAKLQDATRNAFGGMGMGGGGGGGGGGGPGPGLNVTGGGGAQQNQQVIAKTPTIGRALVQGFLDQKDVLKNIAVGSKDSLRVMTESLKQAISYQKRDLQNLDAEAKKLISTYDELAKVMAGAKASGDTDGYKQAAAERAQTGMRHSQVMAKRSQYEADLHTLEGQLPGSGAGAPPPPVVAKPTLMERLTRARGIPGVNAVFGQNTAMGGLMRGVGMNPAMLGNAGVAAIGAWGLKNIGNQLWNAPMFQGRADAAWGQMYGQRGMEIRQGEFRNIMTTQNILRDPSKRQDYEDLNSGWRRFGHSAGAFVSGDFMGALSGRAANLGVRARREEQIANDRSSDPLTDQILGEAQNYQATLGTLRAMGTGPRKGENGLQALARIRTGYAGFDDGAIIGAKQSLEGAGTRGASWSMVGNALQAQAAGIGGAAQSAGIMSRFGGGATGNTFLNRLRSNVGGGSDAVTAGIVGQFVSQQQAQLGMNLGARGGDFQGSGLMDMIQTGTAGVGGRLVAEQNIRGAEYLQRSVTGQTSPYQAARNVMMAMNAAPGASIYGQSFLARKMSMTELADAARGQGGDVNAVFKALGGTKGQAAGYFKEHSKSLLEGLSPDALQGTSAGKMAQALASSGMDPREFFKKGLWKKALGKGATLDDAVAGYAGALQASDANLDPATAMGLARDLTGMGGKRPGQGKRAGDPAGGSQEMQMAVEHINALATQTKALTSEFTQLLGATRALNLRAQLESSGVNFKDMGEKERLIADKVLMDSRVEDKASYQKVTAEFNLAAEARAMTAGAAARELARRGMSLEDMYALGKRHGFSVGGQKVKGDD